MSQFKEHSQFGVVKMVSDEGDTIIYSPVDPVDRFHSGGTRRVGKDTWGSWPEAAAPTRKEQPNEP